MLLDIGFFGWARTGTLNDSYQYPLMLRSREGQIKKESGKLNILGEVFPTLPRTEFHADNPTPLYEESDNILVLTDGTQLIRRPRAFFNYLMKVHSSNKYRKILYLPGISDPFLIPVLVYLGISIFDDFQLRLESRDGIVYGPFGITRSQENTETENGVFVENSLRVLRESIKSLGIRNIVENCQLSATAIALLRMSDRLMNTQGNDVYPSYSGKIFAYNGQALNRPDIVRYRNFISSEYSQPENNKLMLLIPCSARKPYSFSKSHRRIIEAIYPFRKYIHEVIVTSPLGIVPRELEDMYPASFYDVPVTGDWSTDEKLMINSMLDSYIKKGKYSGIIAFLPREYDFISETLEQSEIIWGNHSNDSDLSTLRERLRMEVSNLKEKAVPSSHWNIVSKLRLQFGSWFPDISKDIKVIRSYNLEQVLLDNKVNFVVVPDRGKLTITKNAAHYFSEAGKNLIEIDDFKPTSNIYAVGITGTSDGIRQEDEVVIHHSGEVRGVGVAKMPRDAMLSLSKGVAVKVRN